jgi:hypothetical protein
VIFNKPAKTELVANPADERDRIQFYQLENSSVCRQRRPAPQGKIAMSEPREVEVWFCGYSAACSVPDCHRRATTVLRYPDNQGRPYRRTDGETHALELCVEMKVIDRGRRSE